MAIEIYPIRGMHCASCSSLIENAFKKVDGVDSVEVSFGAERAKISFDPAKTNPVALSKKIEPLGYSLIIPTAGEMGMSESEHAEHLGLRQFKQEKLVELAGMRANLMWALPLTVLTIVLMGWDVVVNLGFGAPPGAIMMRFSEVFLPVVAGLILAVLGKPYLMGVYRFFRYGKANMDTLVGIGTSVAFLYSLVLSLFGDYLSGFVGVEHRYYDVTIVVVAFITLGKYLEVGAKIKTGDAIEKLLNLQAKTALVLKDGIQKEIPIEQVAVGDTILIKPGARIPVDGTVFEGESFVDESMITGEPMPVSKISGGSVVAGTINTTGSFSFNATKVGSETLLARIIKMVEEAQGSRAPIQALADKISSVFVPVVLVLALATLALWILLGTASLGFSVALSYGLTCFVGVLVIACPCALGLATPTAIIVGVGKGAKEGILIKDAATLEKLHSVDTLVVDKTGTITKGKPELVRIEKMGSLSEEELVLILATLETRSEHPIAHAILEYAKRNKVALQSISSFESISGKGVRAVIGGVEYFAGNEKGISDLGLPFDAGLLQDEMAEGKTPVIVASKSEVLGFVLVADAIKPEAVEAVKNLHALGIRILMISGDAENTARAIAREAGIDEVIAEVLPGDKLAKIRELQSHGKIVAMAGDGINDAPALAGADVGIAMGSGTDVAIETAGITLLHGDISKLVKAFRLSRFTMRGIKQNLFWAFFYNILGIPLASGLLYPVFGWLLNPAFAGFAMAFSSVSVVSNSLRLKAKKL